MSKHGFDSADLRIKPGQPVKLSQFDAQGDGSLDKDKTKALTETLHDELYQLQSRLYAEGKQSLLVVLQAMDAGGKDGTIKSVFRGLNPQGVVVTPFKVPTPAELAHDFLWRVHQRTPAKGQIGIFNRSHYEDVLVVRVNQLVPEKVWRARYDQINAFEQMLSEAGTRIVKFYLHISRDEQKERLVDRLNSPDEQWKFSTSDLPVRERWDDYMQAYEEVLKRCSTESAPWYVIPANRKWQRNYFVTRILIETLKDMNPKYPKPEPGLDKVVIRVHFKLGAVKPPVAIRRESHCSRQQPGWLTCGWHCQPSSA
ncbi:MAG: polyphosphate kinase 2 family protein, partial [Chloroflexota bacterium]|nr:polyphosphate kinase 2 family protein [Chloroflexota bacterium]